MYLRKTLFGILGIILAGGIMAFAQEPQPQTPATPDATFRKERIERRQRHRERVDREGLGKDRGMGRRGGAGRLMRDLNLSEEQRQQARAIMQRRLESTKAQREELFRLREKRIAGTFSADDEARAQALHQEIRLAMEGVRTEMQSVLTAEQKAQLEKLKTERKEGREQRIKERMERLNQKPQ
jgi:Spy/CpxP family protein refolding chaperone